MKLVSVWFAISTSRIRLYSAKDGCAGSNSIVSLHPVRGTSNVARELSELQPAPVMPIIKIASSLDMGSNAVLSRAGRAAGLNEEPVPASA